MAFLARMFTFPLAPQQGVTAHVLRLDDICPPSRADVLEYSVLFSRWWNYYSTILKNCQEFFQKISWNPIYKKWKFKRKLEGTSITLEKTGYFWSQFAKAFSKEIAGQWVFYTITSNLLLCLWKYKNAGTLQHRCDAPAYIFVTIQSLKNSIMLKVKKMNKKNCEFTSIHKNQNVVY